MSEPIGRTAERKRKNLKYSKAQAPAFPSSTCGLTPGRRHHRIQLLLPHAESCPPPGVDAAHIEVSFRTSVKVRLAMQA